MKGVAKKYSFTLFGVSLPDAFIRPHQGLKCLFRFGPRKSLAEGWMDEVWRIWSKQIFLVKCKQNPGGNWHYLRTFNSRLKPNEFFIASLTSQNNSDHLPFQGQIMIYILSLTEKFKVFFCTFKKFLLN